MKPNDDFDDKADDCDYDYVNEDEGEDAHDLKMYKTKLFR